MVSGSQKKKSTIIIHSGARLVLPGLQERAGGIHAAGRENMTKEKQMRLLGKRAANEGERAWGGGDGGTHSVSKGDQSVHVQKSS